MSEEAMEECSLEGHYTALGRLCVAWAVLDRQLNDLLAILLGCSSAAAACIASSNDAVAPRCEMMRKLVYEKPRDVEWIGLFVNLMNLISQDLASKRNRFVHDYWSFTEGTLKRLDRRANISRAQSRTPIALAWDTEHVTAPDEVDLLRGRIEDASFRLHCAQRDLETWAQGERLAGPPLLARTRDHFALQDSLQQSAPTE